MPNSDDEIKELRDQLKIENLRPSHPRDDDAPEEPPGLGKPFAPKARIRSHFPLRPSIFTGIKVWGDRGGKSENRNLDCAGHACRGADLLFRLGVVVGWLSAVREFAQRLPQRHRYSDAARDPMTTRPLFCH